MVAVLVVTSDSAPGFRGRNHDAVVDQFQFDNVGGARHRRAHGILVALLEAVGEVAGGFVPDLRRVVAQCRRGVDRGGQRIVVHEHGLGSGARGITGLGDDEGDGIADMADPAIRQRGARRHDHRSHAGYWHVAGQWAERNKISRGKHAQHARHRDGSGGIDGNDQRVCMR